MSDLSPVKVQVNADLTEATNKVVDTVVALIQSSHKGIVHLSRAIWGKGVADRERRIQLTDAQTEKDIEDIKAGRKEYRNGELITLDLVGDTEAYFKQIKENNGACDAKRFGAAILETAVELSQIPDDDISDEPLNQTFFNHWRAEAELIDEEDLRKFWAHLLVEEIKKPNSISQRTLDVAKNISRKEAEFFERIIQGVVNSNAIIINNTGHPLFGSFGEILSLQDARLVGAQISSSQLNANSEDNQKKKIVVIPFMENKLVIAIEKQQITFTNYIMTTAGCEIYRISKKPLSLDQIKIIAEELSCQNENAVVSIYPAEGIFTDSHGHKNCHFSWTPIWTNRSTTSAAQESIK